jgi:catechol 2,3-dioxygenase-like lactoylglutathione lyase family enzyme
VFAPTGWRTVAFDHITVAAQDPATEAAFYAALMGWTLRREDAASATMDIGDWGSAVFEKAPDVASATVRGFSFVIAPWNAKAVERQLSERGLSPVPDNDGHGFESFHVKDPDGFDLQIGNGLGLVKARRSPASAKALAAAPFAATGWRTVWLDHFSFRVTNYKESASFYENLLGWTPTFDEGSQNELMIPGVGDIIVRGGNPYDPAFGKAGAPRRAVLDHISFGIAPWDTDGVKAELERRGLPALVDTSTGDDIHVAAYKSYHTSTPNGFNLQISFVTKANHLALANAVKPK